MRPSSTSTPMATGRAASRTALESCDPPGGAYVTNSDDCNDASADAYMGGFEECDNLDNDCDGVIDPPDLQCGVSDDDDPEPEPVTTGCSSTGTSLLPTTLLMLLPLAFRRRN